MLLKRDLVKRKETLLHPVKAWSLGLTAAPSFPVCFSSVVMATPRRKLTAELEFLFDSLITFCHVLIFGILLMVMCHSIALLPQLLKEDLHFHWSSVYVRTSVYQFTHVHAVPVGARRGQWILWS